MASSGQGGVPNPHFGANPVVFDPYALEEWLRKERAAMKQAVGADPVVFDTGYKRDHVEQARFDLIPMEILYRLALIYGEGARKYGDYNWQKGSPWSDVLNHAMKHFQEWREGDFSEDKLAKVIWGFVTLAWFSMNGRGKNDLRVPLGVWNKQEPEVTE